MKMGIEPEGLGQFLQMFLQEKFPEFLEQYEFDPTEVVVTLRKDATVPSGFTIGCVGRPYRTGDTQNLEVRARLWLTGGDTGISSQAMFGVLMGPPVPKWNDSYNWPRDPSDFGRCFRLLEKFPEFRPRLGEVCAAMPSWEPMITAWPEMESLYREELKNKDGMAPLLYARMQTLGDLCGAIVQGRP
jgi:hypothetical protein